MTVPEVSAVICAYGPEPHLAEVVAAIRASEGVHVEVIVVDNGSPACAGLDPEVVVLEPGENTGFARGCNLGVQAASGSTVVFVNSDAFVEPDCLALLHGELSDPGVALAGATVLLADEPGVVNSWGNPVHLVGFSWAGGYGHDVSEAVSGERASVSGAVFAARRSLYLWLGGMDPAYFMYGEDVDLSLRARLGAGSVRVLSTARAHHHYDFSRNPNKMELVERNRLITVTTTYSARTLAGMAPLLVAAELAVLARSRREGWLRQKVAGWRWLAGHRNYLRHRRNRIQGSRMRSDAELLSHLSVALDPPARFGMSVPAGWQKAIATYWAVVGRRVAGVPDTTGAGVRRP
ncbi:MAG: glycosyltransferase family 2 protein [Micrococcales bacterium]|nr:glycosyltransferase family 2 protein [Micrococcales bacterium]